MLRRRHIRSISTLAAVITSIPVVCGVAGGIYVWLSPNVMLASTIALRSVVWFNLLGLAVLLLSIYRKRWFCRTLCPTGWCCNRVSRKARRIRPVKIPAGTGKCIAVFTLASAIFGYPLLLWIDPLVLFSSFFTTVFRFRELSVAAIAAVSIFPALVFSQWLWPHSWCGKICPVGGMQDMVWWLRSLLKRKNDVRPTTTQGHGITRRELLASLPGLVAGGFLSRIKPEYNPSLRPPASLATPKFETICLRCGNCVRACPSHIIKWNTHPGDWYAWMSPMIDLSGGYCLSDCTMCGTVCPSGAISPFTVSAKKRLPIGKARIDTENCLLQRFGECAKCQNVCAYNAIQITSIHDAKVLPLPDDNRCVGCGACAQICPEGVIRIVNIQT